MMESLNICDFTVSDIILKLLKKFVDTVLQTAEPLAIFSTQTLCLSKVFSLYPSILPTPRQLT